MKSAIYSGSLHHCRVTPKYHDFTYSVVMFYLDLSETDKIFRFPFVKFRRKDYLKGADSLSEAVKDLVKAKTGRIISGPIRVLTQVSYFGFCFNPVSIYYCFDQHDQELEFIVAEITNTPWHERHAYVLECKKGKDHHFEFKKDFHVSPFFPMDLFYHWDFTKPVPSSSAPLVVRMADWEMKENKRVFNATLSLSATELTQWNLLKIILQFPLLTIKAVIAIYYQALLLKVKGVPFYSNPTSGEKKV